MSVIGIDVGSSSVKMLAYSEDGAALASYRVDLAPRHPQPGWWEQDPEEVWQATLNGLRSLASADAVRADPPRAIAISASGRENFPLDAHGNALGPCIMAGDLRGSEFEARPEGASHPEPWTLSCGHLRERMDPVFRLMYWRKAHPAVIEQARYFVGWHEFLALRLTGRAVVDRSIVGRWLAYDLLSGTWDSERVAECQIDSDLLPEILPWGEIIGPIRQAVVDATGLPAGILLAVGALDLTCAAVGLGILEQGAAALVSGSFENLLIPTASSPTPSLLLRGLSVTPHPGPSGYAVLALSPTGTMVLNWVRRLLDVSIEELDARLASADPAPSPVMAIPYLSGSMLYWDQGRKARGGVLGLTLATSDLDVIRAFMESITYDHVNTFSVLRETGLEVRRIVAAGGGSRSAWWTQLKADMLNASIEASCLPEPGTVGAAMLAGVAVGTYSSVDEAICAFSQAGGTLIPDPERASLHRARLDAYREIVPLLISTIYHDT